MWPTSWPRPTSTSRPSMSSAWTAILWTSPLPWTTRKKPKNCSNRRCRHPPGRKKLKLVPCVFSTDLLNRHVPQLLRAGWVGRHPLLGLRRRGHQSRREGVEIGVAGLYTSGTLGGEVIAQNRATGPTLRVGDHDAQGEPCGFGSACSIWSGVLGLGES